MVAQFPERLHEMDSVDIDDQIAARNLMRVRKGQHPAQGPAEGVALLGFQDEVKAVDAFYPGDGRGGGAEDTYFI